MLKIKQAKMAMLFYVCLTLLSGAPCLAQDIGEDLNVLELEQEFIEIQDAMDHAENIVEAAPPQPTPSAPAVAQGDVINLDDAMKDIMAPVGNEPQQVPLQPVQQGAQVVQPEATQLADPAPEEVNLPDIPSLTPQSKPEDNVFYDADALVPSAEFSRKGGPEKVDPRTQPGSKLIVVKKNSAAGSRKANIVAAERAMKLGRYAAAAEMYEALYARSKRDPAILMGRALAYQRLGQHDMAVESYERLLDIRPKNLEARVNMLGIIGQRYPAVAARQLLDLREEYPDNVGLVAQVAVMQAKLQNFDEAVRYLGIAASMEPQNASHVFNMAVIADKAGDKKKAIEYYEEALEVDSIYGKGATIPRDSVFERLAALR